MSDKWLKVQHEEGRERRRKEREAVSAQVERRAQTTGRNLGRRSI